MPGEPAELHLRSSAFENGTAIPEKYTADGPNVSPPLEWQDGAPGTQTFALLCEDPDAPHGLFSHWMVFNIPPTTHSLSEAASGDSVLPEGSWQGKNSAGHAGYCGPAPPPGPAHRYVFRVFALDCRLDLSAGASRQELMGAMANHVVGRGELLGIYGRTGSHGREHAQRLVEQTSSCPPQI